MDMPVEEASLLTLSSHPVAPAQPKSYAGPQPRQSSKRPANQKPWQGKKSKKGGKSNPSGPNQPSQNVSHDKDTSKSESTGIQMYAARRPFIIFVSNHGIDMLARIVFRAIRARDSKLVQNCTEVQLKYVLNISYLNRIVQTAIRSGYTLDIDAASVLNNAAKGIQLPGILAKYIEAIGLVKTASGITVAPFAGNYDAIFPPDHPFQITLEELLEEAGRPIPANVWRIDYTWIEEWNENTTRPSRLGMAFQTVDFTNDNGRTEMLVSVKYERDPDDPLEELNVVGVAPQQLSEAEGHLGACYQYRDYDNQDHWLPGVRQLLFAAYLTTNIQATRYFSDVVTKSFTSKPNEKR